MRALLHRCSARLALALALAGLTGCVERRMVIISEPFGAVVFDEKNQPLGAAPVDRTFVYYGKYRFRLVKDGYETAVVDENVSAPWYEWPGFDFFSENLLPFTIRDVRYIRVPLHPLQIIPPDQLLNDATSQRQRGQGIGVPLPEGPAPRVLPPQPDTPAPVPPPTQPPVVPPVTPVPSQP